MRKSNVILVSLCLTLLSLSPEAASAAILGHGYRTCSIAHQYSLMHFAGNDRAMRDCDALYRQSQTSGPVEGRPDLRHWGTVYCEEG